AARATAVPQFILPDDAEKQRLIRLFSQINDLYKQMALPTTLQQQLLEDYLDIVFCYGKEYAGLADSQLKRAWDALYQLPTPHTRQMAKEIQLRQFSIIRAMYNAKCKKYPYPTQMIVLLCAAYLPDNLLFKLDTGEGKSIAMALVAVWLFLTTPNKKSAYMTSRNVDLGRQDYIDKQNRDFIRAFGIPCSDDLIRPSTPREEYDAVGIYYLASFPGLSLKQSLHSFIYNDKKFSDGYLLIDEVDDALLNDLTLFNLTINAENVAAQHDAKSWIYPVINTFYDTYKDSDLLVDEYALADKLRATLFAAAENAVGQKQLVAHLSHDTLIKYFYAADAATLMLSGVEYVIGKPKNGCSRAVPLRKGEPQDESIFTDNDVHSCLHARLQEQNLGKPPFRALPENIYIGSATAKTVTDLCKQHRIIALSATPGTWSEVIEMRTKHNMLPLQIQPYNPNRRTIHPLALVEDDATLINEIISIIRSRAIGVFALQQPILIYCRDGRVAKDYYEKLRRHFLVNIQLINGEESEEERATLIKAADQAGFITVTTLLLQRGVDFKPQATHGGCLIQTFLAHERDTLQIMG
ncbi:MAG TPA: hypothetical protein VHD33_03130, partial [Legionellaceae bacterium]|nr:hypothetical protein [Legionellaceae bacterium]